MKLKKGLRKWRSNLSETSGTLDSFLSDCWRAGHFVRILIFISNHSRSSSFFSLCYLIDKFWIKWLENFLFRWVDKERIFFLNHILAWLEFMFACLFLLHFFYLLDLLYWIMNRSWLYRRNWLLLIDFNINLIILLEAVQLWKLKALDTWYFTLLLDSYISPLIRFLSAENTDVILVLSLKVLQGFKLLGALITDEWSWSQLIVLSFTWSIALLQVLEFRRDLRGIKALLRFLSQKKISLSLNFSSIIFLIFTIGLRQLQLWHLLIFNVSSTLGRQRIWDSFLSIFLFRVLALPFRLCGKCMPFNERLKLSLSRVCF